MSSVKACPRSLLFACQLDLLVKYNVQCQDATPSLFLYRLDGPFYFFKKTFSLFFVFNIWQKTFVFIFISLAKKIDKTYAIISSYSVSFIIHDLFFQQEIPDQILDQNYFNESKSPTSDIKIYLIQYQYKLQCPKICIFFGSCNTMA